MANDINPTDWGWKEGSHQFIPIMTEKNAARDELLHVIHCNCSAQDANPPDAAVDVMDFLVLQHVVHAKLKTVITPTTPKRLILRTTTTKTLTI